MKRTFTKYPSGYVKASDEPHAVGDNEIVDIYIGDGSEAGFAPETFYMEADTQYDVIRIYCKPENYVNGKRADGRYTATDYENQYTLESEANGIIDETIFGNIVRKFYSLYDVKPEFRKEISQESKNYYT